MTDEATQGLASELEHFTKAPMPMRKKEFHDAPLSSDHAETVSQFRGTENDVARNKHRFRPGAPAEWEAARLEFEHQAEHWDTPDHGETGHLIAQALRAAVDIAQSGGLRCEHRPGSLPAVGLDAGSARDEVTATRTAADRHHCDAAGDAVGARHKREQK